MLKIIQISMLLVISSVCLASVPSRIQPEAAFQELQQKHAQALTKLSEYENIFKIFYTGQSFKQCLENHSIPAMSLEIFKGLNESKQQDFLNKIETNVQAVAGLALQLQELEDFKFR
jgi:hypothetical protein